MSLPAECLTSSSIVIVCYSRLYQVYCMIYVGRGVGQDQTVCSDASSGGPCFVKVGGLSIFQVMISSRSMIAAGHSSR
jgi:hypothetical protein